MVINKCITIKTEIKVHQNNYYKLMINTKIMYILIKKR